MSGSHARAFAIAAYAIQFFYGGWFFYNGLNYFVAITPAPPGSSPLSRELIGALEHTGLFAIVKAVELATGAALLANRFVPLATVIAFPVSFSIAFVMLIVNGGVVGTTVGVLVMAFNGVIALARLDSFRPMLAMHDRAARAPDDRSRTAVRLSPAAHAAGIILGVGIAFAIEWVTIGHFQAMAR